jgi:hypothetical protein
MQALYRDSRDEEGKEREKALRACELAPAPHRPQVEEEEGGGRARALPEGEGDVTWRAVVWGIAAFLGTLFGLLLLFAMISAVATASTAS